MELNGENIFKSPNESKTTKKLELKVLKEMPIELSKNPETKILAEQVLREVVKCSSNSSITFEDVIGLPEAKQILQESICLPQHFPNSFKNGNNIYANQ